MASDFFMMPILKHSLAERNHTLWTRNYPLPMNTYGDRLEHALFLAKKDRAALSQGIGISIQAIGQVIAGKTKALTAENSARAARFLGVDHTWLATGEGSPHPNRESLRYWPFLEITVEQWYSYDDSLREAWETWLLNQMRSYDTPAPVENKSPKTA